MDKADLLYSKPKPKDKTNYEDCCTKCSHVQEPELVYPANDGLRSLYVCDKCNHGWQTWFSNKYEDFIQQL